MVGFEGEPGSNAEGFAKEVGQTDTDVEGEETQDYFIGTDTENVRRFFEKSEQFESVGDDKYVADGMTAEVTEDGVEYSVAQGASDETVDEFVHEIVGRFGDVDPEFVDEVDQEIYDQARDVRADGGYEVECIPTGGMPSYVDSDTDTKSVNFMGNFPM